MPVELATLPRGTAEPAWRAAAAAHAARVDAWTAGHRQRSPARLPHPVEDFLFTYYNHRPAQLRRWHAGVGTALLGDAAQERLQWRHYAEVEAVDEDGRSVPAIGLDVGGWLTQRSDALRHIRSLLLATASRPAHLGCFGMHEWAMVYRAGVDGVRHSGWPLRLGHEGTDAVVESHPLRCSHFDAFRFFTEAARPLNALQPSRFRQTELEQPGCLHATMDLYKWAYKLSPAVPSDVLADCFALAREVRELDMRASPYDLRELGYEPVCIETPEGKAEYVRMQRGFAERGQMLRSALLEALQPLVTAAKVMADDPSDQALSTCS